MDERTETIEVGEGQPEERLDTYLSGIYQAVSRATIQRLIKEGEIRVDDQPVKPSYKLSPGEKIRVHFPEPKPAKVEAVEIPLEILYEDSDLIVVNKQPGLLTHMASGREENTLVNALLHHCAGQLSGVGGVARPGIVHRLDKDTSGCIVAAKNDEAHLGLSAQFAERETEKIYWAIVCGEVTPKAGHIRAAIARHPGHRMCMVVDSGGKEAHTSYQVIRWLRRTTLVKVFLHTGRTHQIRVHFKHVGFPLVGDEIYAKRQNQKLTQETGLHPARQMLHSQTLAFKHPRTGERLRFQAPLPEDFTETLAALELPDAQE